MEEECKHGFDRSWCAACKDPVHGRPRSLKPADDREDWEKPQPRRALAVRYTFTAEYSSTPCFGCGQKIRQGQSMALMTDGSYRHNLPGCILATAGQATYSDRKGARE